MGQSRLTTDSLIVLTSNDITAPETIHVESDCACPAGSFSHRPPATLSAPAVHYILPPLHLDTPAAGFHLAFNPLGGAGMAVLNDAAFQLLEAFQQPRTLADGARAAGDPPAGLATAQRLADLSLLVPFGQAAAPPQATSQTLTAWLHVTNECNLRCPYCYVHKTPDELDLERGRQAIDAVFRSAVANQFPRVKIKYAGGEATLNFQTVQRLHEHARLRADLHNISLEGIVLSNGVALTHRMIEALQAHNLRLMISLDGVDAAHDIQRPFVNGHGSFHHVERALDRLAAHNFTPSISITISRRNLGGLADVVAYVLRRDLPFKLNFYRENDCSASFADLAYADQQIIDAMWDAFAVIATNPPRYSLLEALVDLARLDMPHDRACGVGHSYMVINQHGGVAKCHMELERPVTDITAADPLLLLRADRDGLLNLSVEEKEGCRDCAWRYWCAGGCPALTYRVTGRFDVKSPNCRIYQALFPEVLRLEGLRLLKYGGVPAA